MLFSIFRKNTVPLNSITKEMINKGYTTNLTPEEWLKINDFVRWKKKYTPVVSGNVRISFYIWLAKRWCKHSDDSLVSDSEESDVEAIPPPSTRKRNREAVSHEDQAQSEIIVELRNSIRNELKKELQNEIQKEFLTSRLNVKSEVAASEKRMERKLSEMSTEYQANFEKFGMRYNQLEAEIVGMNKKICNIDENLQRGFEVILARLSENSGQRTGIPWMHFNTSFLIYF